MGTLRRTLPEQLRDAADRLAALPDQHPELRILARLHVGEKAHAGIEHHTLGRTVAEKLPGTLSVVGSLVADVRGSVTFHAPGCATVPRATPAVVAYERVGDVRHCRVCESEQAISDAAAQLGRLVISVALLLTRGRQVRTAERACRRHFEGDLLDAAEVRSLQRAATLAALWQGHSDRRRAEHGHVAAGSGLAAAHRALLDTLDDAYEAMLGNLDLRRAVAYAELGVPLDESEAASADTIVLVSAQPAGKESSGVYLWPHVRVGLCEIAAVPAHVSDALDVACTLGRVRAGVDAEELLLVVARVGQSDPDVSPIGDAELATVSGWVDVAHQALQ